MLTSTPAFPPASQMDILYSTATIAERVAEIGREITADYEGQTTGHPLVLIGVLKGAAIFLSDLARAIHIDNTFDFVAVSSYGRARVSSGAVKLGGTMCVLAWCTALGLPGCVTMERSQVSSAKTCSKTKKTYLSFVFAFSV